MNQPHVPQNFQDLNDLEKKEALESLQSEMTESSTDMNQIQQASPNPRLDVQTFFNVFLPYFADTEFKNMYFKDDPGPGGTTAHQKAMMAWQHVVTQDQPKPAAGGRMVASWLYAQVDIVDPNGTVVCTTPPIVSFQHFNYKRDGKRMDVARVVHGASVYAGQSQRHAALFLRQHLTAGASSLIDDKAIIDNLVKWNVIFKQFGFPLIGEGILTELEPEGKEVKQERVFNPSEFDDE